MLMIRLQRVGRKHEPVFRLVLTDSKNSPKSGKFLEVLGNYDARHTEKASLKEERVKYWMDSGAKLSDTVHNFLLDRKLITGKKINKLPKKKPIVSEKPAEETKAEATPAATEEAVETEATPVESEPIAQAEATAETASEEALTSTKDEVATEATA